MKVLIVDDEPTILETIETKLRREGYTTFVAVSAEQGLNLFRKVKPDLIILDIMLPNRSGFEMCQVIRQESQTPVIFLSAKNEERDRIKGLELGADDYVSKPFNLNELAARVKAVLRRSTGETLPEVLEVGDLKIDPRSHEAFRSGRKLALSPREFSLLYFLVKNEGRVFSREVLLDRVWGRDAYVSERSVDVHIRWLRVHIEADPMAPERLITVRGVGYKFMN